MAQLTKIYPGRKDENGAPIAAVDDVSLRVGAGEIFGLLGPNGAGKSTTIRMIASLLEPTSGTVRVDGFDVRTDQIEVRRRLGVVLGGERSVYWKLTARQNLEYFAALHGASRRRSRTRIDEVLEQMDLLARADDYVESYSTGMRQRLVIARALLGRPTVLLLDEPTTGLDPHAATAVHEHIRQLKASGHTIILTTHYMEEADALSDRLGIIDGGRLIAEGTSVRLKSEVGIAQVLHARLRLRHAERLDALLADLGAKAEVESIAADDGLDLTVRSKLGDDLVPWLIVTAGHHDAAVLRVESEPVSLKDVFLTLTGKELRE
ncbi:ABC transporter ATP-binding protein [Salinispora pacifica]|uniref:ABC transporter ATP-binding protein n=1 Tax=Salinispora pacifica TaxID=351187 RepID=UPI00036B0426|nr:ABC transporter ATP-binding protein [Salinispora pacifica]